MNSKKWLLDTKDLPAKPGVYIICPEKKLESALYVGQSNNIKKRLTNNHPAYRKAIAEYGNVFISWEHIPGQDERNYKESLLIGELRPKYNFGNTKSIQDDHGFKHDNWEIITPDFISRLGSKNDEQIEICKEWLNDVWEYKQHGMLFTYLRNGCDVINMSIRIISGRSDGFDYVFNHNEELYSEINGLFTKYEDSKNFLNGFRQAFKEISKKTFHINMFPVYFCDRFGYECVDATFRCLLQLQGLNNSVEMSHNSVKKCCYYFNKNLVTIGYDDFLKMVKTKLGKKVRKDIIDLDAPKHYLQNVIFWSILKDEPFLSLPTHLIKEWFNYMVLEYVYRNKHLVEEFKSGYISSDSFTAAFYEWCLENDEIPEINYKFHPEGKGPISSGTSRVRIG